MNPFKNNNENHKIKFLKPQKLLQLCHSALLSLCLTGCMGVYEGGFECPPGIGVGCKSISEVNQMIDQCSSGAELKCAEKVQEYQKGPLCEAASGSIENKIWYPPSAVSSAQWCSTQSCSTDTYSSQIKSKRERDKADAQDSI